MLPRYVTVVLWLFHKKSLQVNDAIVTFSWSSRRMTRVTRSKPAVHPRACPTTLSSLSFSKMNGLKIGSSPSGLNTARVYTRAHILLSWCQLGVDLPNFLVLRNRTAVLAGFLVAWKNNMASRYVVLRLKDWDLSIDFTIVPRSKLSPW